MENYYRGFAKDFEALIKLMSDLGDPLIHTKSYLPHSWHSEVT